MKQKLVVLLYILIVLRSTDFVNVGLCVRVCVCVRVCACVCMRVHVHVYMCIV